MRVLQHAPVPVVGVILALIGILAAFVAQMALGASWRIGVDDRERAELVTTVLHYVADEPSRRRTSSPRNPETTIRPSLVAKPSGSPTRTEVLFGGGQCGRGLGECCDRSRT